MPVYAVFHLLKRLGQLPMALAGHAVEDTLHQLDRRSPAIRDLAADSNVELVPTSTYASFLNQIEAQFAAVTEFVIRAPTTTTAPRSRKRWPITSVRATLPAAQGGSPFDRAPPTGPADNPADRRGLVGVA
jgi:hypothetical protein